VGGSWGDDWSAAWIDQTQVVNIKVCDGTVIFDEEESVPACAEIADAYWQQECARVVNEIAASLYAGWGLAKQGYVKVEDVFYEGVWEDLKSSLVAGISLGGDDDDWDINWTNWWLEGGGGGDDDDDSRGGNDDDDR